jgi:Cft2 family RNA processing exonuclease
MKVTSFGTGSSGNTIMLTNNNGRHLILDAGINPKKILPAIDFNVNSIDGVLVSHAHMDHARYIKQYRDKAVDVYAIKETFADKHHRNKEINYHEWYQAGEFLICAHEADHDIEGCAGFIVDADDDRAVYSTDTAGLLYEIVKPTILIYECNYSEELFEKSTYNDTLKERIRQTHRSLKELLYELDKMDKSSLRAIYVTHLSDANADEKVIETAVKSATGVEVYIL